MFEKNKKKNYFLFLKRKKIIREFTVEITIYYYFIIHKKK